jgi:hypothetical protein
MRIGKLIAYFVNFVHQRKLIRLGLVELVILANTTTSHGEVMGSIRSGKAWNLGKPGAEMADEQNDDNN